MSDQSNVKQTEWGYEIYWADADTYTGKIVVFNKPGRTNMSFHKENSKSWFINDGNFKIRWIDTSTGQLYESDVKEGSVFHVPKMMPASIEVLTSTGSFTEVGDKISKDECHIIVASNNIGKSDE